MSEPIKEKLPQPTVMDHGHAIAKGVISDVIPWAGSTAAELFGIVIAPPLAKRRDQWLEGLATDLRGLEAKVSGFSIKALSSNEDFVTAVMHATTAAMKNHQREKLDALRNAVLNSALQQSADANLHLIFLGWVDSLTPLHLRVLRLLSEPETWGDWNEPPQPPGTTGGPENVIQAAFSELRGRRDLCLKIVKDLANDGLLATAKSKQTSGRSVLVPEITAIGERFLAFIAPPKFTADR